MESQSLAANAAGAQELADAIAPWAEEHEVADANRDDDAAPDRKRRRLHVKQPRPTAFVEQSKPNYHNRNLVRSKLRDAWVAALGVRTCFVHFLDAGLVCGGGGARGHAMVLF